MWKHLCQKPQCRKIRGAFIVTNQRLARRSLYSGSQEASAVRRSSLERVLNPLDARRGAVRIPHYDDVESHRQLRQLRTLLQELARRAGDAPLFAPVDARRRAAIRGARAGAHLGDYQHARAARDEIELAEPAQVVALQDLKAARARSEERRVGKECRSRWSPYH